MNMAETFEQQPKEGAKAFEAYSVYMNLGAGRSLAEVGRKLGKSVGLIERWSRKFDWPERVKAQETHLALVEREATEALARQRGAQKVKRQAEQLEEEWQTRNEALVLARAAISRWKANEKRCGSLEGIARLLDLASKLGRLATGMPTDRTEVTGEDGGPIRIEFEAALRKVYGAEGGSFRQETEKKIPPRNEGGVVLDVEALPSGEPDGLPGRRAISGTVSALPDTTL
jgi:hypothetical protein